MYLAKSKLNSHYLYIYNKDDIILNTNKTYRFIALSLAFLMFFSSAGLAVDFHYCQGKLKTLGIFQDAKSCHELVANTSHCHMAEKSSCHKKAMKSSCSKDKGSKGCCDNEKVFILLDADYGAAEYVSLNIVQVQFVAAFITIFYHLFLETDSSRSHFNNYKPPPLDRDILVLVQSFLC